MGGLSGIRARVTAVTFLVLGASLLAWFLLDKFSLETKLATHIADAHEYDFAIADATPFPWEQFFAFPPYTETSDVQRQLKVRWAPPRSADIESSDGFALLVFLNDGEVVEHVALPRNAGDFARVPIGPYSPATAVFRVVPRRSWPYIEAAHPEFLAKQRELLSRRPR